MSVGSISSARLTLFGDIARKLDAYDGRGDVRHHIFADIADLMEMEFGASYKWDGNTGRSENGMTINMSECADEEHREYFQFRDPISSKMRAARRAVRVEEVIAREELEQTEFWHEFLNRDGLHFGVNLFLFDGDTDLGDFRIWRGRNSRPFDDGDIALLDGLAPHLARAFLRHDKRFAGLTARECDVAHLVAKGCRDQDICRILGISMSTVRTHLHNAMEKRFCANRAELAANIMQREI